MYLRSKLAATVSPMRQLFQSVEMTLVEGAIIGLFGANLASKWRDLSEGYRGQENGTTRRCLDRCGPTLMRGIQPFAMGDIHRQNGTC